MRLFIKENNLFQQVQEPRRLSSGDPLANFMQTNQASQPQDMRRISTGDPVMSFLKANPTIITKPASPTPPPQQQPMVNIMEPPASTPRVPTPRRQSSVSPILQQTFFSQQTPGSPRVPSPISKYCEICEYSDTRKCAVIVLSWNRVRCPKHAEWQTV